MVFFIGHSKGFHVASYLKRYAQQDKMIQATYVETEGNSMARNLSKWSCYLAHSACPKGFTIVTGLLTSP